MHTKDNGDTRGGSWTLRIGALALGASLAWSLTGPSAAAAEPCDLAIIGTCSDSEEPPAPTTTTTAAPAPPPAAPELSSAEAAARLLSLLNDERARAGLAPFAMRGDVTEIAAGWSAAMAQSAQLSHNDAYFTTETRNRLDARMLGENVARNPSIDGAHRALMASPPHRANILDARFVVIGLAAELRDGSWWVTQDFVQPATAAPPRAAAAPAPAPTEVTTSSTAAPSAAAGGPVSTPTTSVASTAPVDEGEVLAATASDGSVVHLSAGRTSEAQLERDGAATSSSSPRVPPAAAASAAGLIVLALLGGVARRTAARSS